MVKVTIENGGFIWYLRSTVWTDDVSRASEFKTVTDAQAALEKARKFMKAAMYKRAKIG